MTLCICNQAKTCKVRICTQECVLYQAPRYRLPSSLCQPSLRAYFNWDDSRNDDYAKRPRLLDTFCGSGGISMGYYLAGFAPYGIDNNPQPLRHYPFPWICMDALEALDRLIKGEGLMFSNRETLYLGDLVAIHASPPCQGYSIMNNLPWLRGREYPLLILPTLELLEKLGKPYVIENVMGARHGAKSLAKRGLTAHGLKAGWLCGGMFGLPIYRHRLFATNWAWLAPGHPKHRGVILTGRNLGDRQHDIIVKSPAKRQYNGAQADGVGIGHARGWRKAALAMGIDWMTQDELTQAIPPVYTEYIGKYLMTEVVRRENESRA